MILPLFFTLLSAAGAPGSSSLVISPCDAGVHRQFEVVDCEIELRNSGDRAIVVSQGEAKVPWDRIDTSKITIAPHSTAYIKATVDLRNDEGEIRRYFRFQSDEPGLSPRGSEVRAFVLPLLDQSKPALDFGTVRLGDETLPSTVVDLTSREVADLKLTGVVSKPDWMSVAIDAEGRSIRATLKRSVPWGLLHLGQYYVKLRTNAKLQPEVWVAVHANVLGDVVPDADPYPLGVLRTNEKHEFLLRLSSRTNQDFEIGDLRFEGILGSATVEPCTPMTKGCKLLRISISNEQPAGKLAGTLHVGLPKLKKTLPVELVGMLLSPETKIHHLEDLVTESTEKSGGMSSNMSRADIGQVIKEAVREEVPAPQGNGPLLRWSVAHQAPIYGYAIYRADREQGPYVRVNRELVSAWKEGKDKSGNYQWRDTTAKSGNAYWYRIGIVNRDGSKQDLTGPQKAVAK